MIFLFGPPGAGKGTAAQKLEAKDGYVVVSSGSLLRELAASGTEEGNRVDKVMKQGERVDEDLTFELVAKEILSSEGSVLLDGYPREREAGKRLKDFLVDHDFTIRAFFCLKVSEDILEERICNRRIHKKSGRVYNLKLNPPQSWKVSGEMLDDETGEPLERRKDDTPEVLKKRLDVYHRDTEEVMDIFLDYLVSIDADQSMEAVYSDIRDVLCDQDSTLSL